MIGAMDRPGASADGRSLSASGGGWRCVVVMPVLVAVATLGVYGALAPKAVTGGDVGEFATLFHEGGVAHPPGFPVYVGALRLLHGLYGLGVHRLLASPAHGAALATSVLSATGVGLLAAACRRWGARTSASVVAAGTFGLHASVWRATTEPEVFGMVALLGAAVLWVTAPVRSKSGVSGVATLGTLGVVAGLGIGTHTTLVLLAPVGLWAAARDLRRAPTTRAKLGAIAAGLGGLALGLSPYLTLMMAPKVPGAWVWGDTSTLGGVLRHALREEYGTFQLGPGAESRDAAEQLRALLDTVALQGPALALLLLSTLALVAARVTKGEHPGRGDDPPWWPLVASLLLSGPLFLAMFNVPPTGATASLVQRFHVLPQIVLAVLVARLVDRALGAVGAKERSALPAAVGLVLATGAASWGPVARARRPYVDAYLRDVLRGAPANALVLGDSDTRAFGILYLQRVEGLRPDVSFATLPLLERSWYLARFPAGIQRAHGESRDLVSWVRRVLEEGRPVVLLDLEGPYEALAEAFPGYLVGPGLRLLPPGIREPPPEEVFDLNVAFASGSPNMAAWPLPPLGWERAIRGDYARTWRALEGELRGDATGRGESAHGRAAALAPWWRALP